jgi:hypothetical protein
VSPTQAFWSNFERGDGGFQLIHYAVFGILALILIGDKKSIERLMIFQIAISIPNALYALLQGLTDPTKGGGFVIAPAERVSGTLGNPSYLAAYLLFTLVFITYFIITNKNLTWRIVLGIIAVFEGAILLKTGTRAAFLAIIAGIAVVVLVKALTTEQKKLRIYLFALMIAMALGIGGFFATRHSEVWTHVPVLNRLIDFNSAISDIRPRIWTWGSATAGVIAKPLLGWGPENFPGPMTVTDSVFVGARPRRFLRLTVTRAIWSP